MIPTATELRSQVAVYVSEATAITKDSLVSCQSNPQFLEIYRTSLSTDTVLKGLAHQHLRPRINGPRSIVLRLPLLVGVGQLSVSMVELRRFVELVCWMVYFSDHPVEWRSFETKSNSGFSQDHRKPISHAAHRELSFYLDYVKELMGAEPSGLGLESADTVRQCSYELNASVHAGQIAQLSGRIPPCETLSEQALRSVAKLQRRVFASCSLILAAFQRSRFDRLNATGRAQFDWLVGSKVRKKVRQGPFGLP